MIAAENGALPGGKVGGIGDVIRDLPQTLVARGHHVTVVTPGYQAFSKLRGAVAFAQSSVSFTGQTLELTWFRVPSAHTDIEFRVVEHAAFAACGAGKIYCDDPPQAPFARDATKFALLCLAVAEGIKDSALATPDVMHLHDWHAALLPLLRAHHPRYIELRDIPMLYSIHNLSLQGIRPLAHNESSLANWFRDVVFPTEDLVDPRYGDCVNPTRVALRLCDAVHAVSPNYAREILVPSDPAHGFVGGEGLELDLQEAQREGRLFGILNGVEYPAKLPARLSQAKLLAEAEALVDEWLARADSDTHRLAKQRIVVWRKNPIRRGILITSVGRITRQKMQLLMEPVGDATALDALLITLGDAGRFIVVGSGDPEVESALAASAARCDNLLFLQGYAEAFGYRLYSGGDLFLMPSSFEPCGISQMLAMRSGQPCLVHGVGGLLDTVVHGETGFVFDGKTPAEKVQHLLACFEDALDIWRHNPESWEAMREAAAAQRFSWKAAAVAIEHAYQTTPRNLSEK